MANIELIRVPDIGEFEGVEVIELLVAVGDEIHPEQPLITLESDKANMEVPAPKGGRITELLVAVGDHLSEGSPILNLEVEVEAEADVAADTKAPAPAGPSAPPATDKGSRPAEVRVPDIGDFHDVEVIEVLVSPGDVIEAEQPLIALESDKATLEVPAPQAGRVVSVLLKVGDRVSEGSPVLLLDGETEVAAPAPAKPAPAPSPAQPAAAAEAPRPRAAPDLMIDEAAFHKAHASPAVRRFARELGADIARIQGSGLKGRILKEDVTVWIKRALTRGAPGTSAAVSGAGIPPMPEIDFAKFGPVEEQPLPRIKRISGPHLHRAWLNVPMVTHHDEADITELEAFRQSLKEDAAAQGVRITVLAFITKALVESMRAYPEFNASLSPDGERLITKHYHHIGIAVDTPNGLVVPVLRDVDRMSIIELSRELAGLSEKARAGKLTPSDLQGGCISISSLGGIGGTAFTPIVNAPEVAILGVTRAKMQPVWDGSTFIPRLMLPLDLTYDHRVIDGATAARFVAHLSQILGDIRRLLL